MFIQTTPPPPPPIFLVAAVVLFIPFWLVSYSHNILVFRANRKKFIAVECDLVSFRSEFVKVNIIFALYVPCVWSTINVLNLCYFQFVLCCFLRLSYSPPQKLAHIFMFRIIHWHFGLDIDTIVVDRLRTIGHLLVPVFSQWQCLYISLLSYYYCIEAASLYTFPKIDINFSLKVSWSMAIGHG